ncbi:hypothetical protein A2867_03890 [Candidatus Daviesbacteria bacterium RIFCSPHIGHO2_01_FULL_40_11]|uniref:DUF1554 domain-containing protein n=1 Tax=Candidatus Daviesbacteria bacterium RIFCSPHIGHO2_01_FULL_40_11 TaxID=1797762 RepID=A0A1F5JGF5_9BACT|nr:MAG: hypothetical protein A2867_03890 [Candidatus Daviesbacteria bacterium RIFCSPHIGHO2_01_FULL_40_11]
MKKVTGYSLPAGKAGLQGTVVISLLIFIAFFLLYPNPYTLTPTSAQACPTQTTNPRAGGLISAPDISGSSGKFSNPVGVCVVDPQAAFVPFRIGSYNELRSLYFDQAKTSNQLKKITFTGDTGEGALSNCLTNPTCWDQDSNTSELSIYITGSVEFANGPLTGTKSAVIFIDGNLNINPGTISPQTQYPYGTANTGVVLVVGGNVSIDPVITRIDAVIISGGKIYTAGEDCRTSSVDANPLTVNGSLISLNPGSIVFCRSLASNTQAAEIIEHQAKYLVILRNLLSETWQKWSEITEITEPIPESSPTPIPSPTPSPSPITSPSPSPTPTPSPTPPSFKNVFVTSQYYTGNLGGLAGADQKCQQLADAAGIGSSQGLTYKAWLSNSTGSSPANRFTRSDVPYRLVEGTLVANNWADLTDGNLAAPISKDDTGATRFNIVYTATRTDGSWSGIYSDCNNWTLSEDSNNASGGLPDYTDALWTQGTGASCGFTQARLYCFEQ